MKAASLALKFLLELPMVAAFAVWGSTIGTGAASVAAAVVAPAAAIVLWGIFAAPRSKRRLRTRARVSFELAVFGLAAAALAAAGYWLAALAFAVFVLVNAVLLTVFDQWES
jgi:Protein of unknown function (DUF2568)